VRSLGLRIPSPKPSINLGRIEAFAFDVEDSPLVFKEQPLPKPIVLIAEELSPATVEALRS
jgi:hypothetical protein